MALWKGRIFPSQYQLPAGTKQEYISETSGTLPGNHQCRGGIAQAPATTPSLTPRPGWVAC
eukprot:scaffold67965_cov55-Phaeocystis_antarctica.AAC.1